MIKQLLIGAALLALPTLAPADDRFRVPPRAHPEGPGTGDFDRFDANDDGSVSRQEARYDPTLVSRFRDFDEDHDGRLSQAEFDAAALDGTEGSFGANVRNRLRKPGG